MQVMRLITAASLLFGGTGCSLIVDPLERNQYDRTDAGPPDACIARGEACNGEDDDCDDRVDEGLIGDFYLDVDGDSYGVGEARSGCSPNGEFTATRDGDCDDENAAISPGASEHCDTFDNDCDDTADEDLPLMRCYRDEDVDGYGLSAISEMRCACVDGWAAVAADCHDAHAGVHPGADFTEERYCAPPTTECSFPGNSDWNCDGESEPRWTRYATNCLYVNCNGAIGAGWCDSVGIPRPGIPACAAEGDWCECRPGADGKTCDVTVSSRRQECR